METAKPRARKKTKKKRKKAKKRKKYDEIEKQVLKSSKTTNSKILPIQIHLHPQQRQEIVQNQIMTQEKMPHA